MGLKQRKKLKNISRFTEGSDGNQQSQYWDWQNNKPNQDQDSGYNLIVNKAKPQTASNQANPLASKGIAVAQGATSIASNFMSQTKNVPTGDQMIADAGTSEGSVMGMNYTKQNTIDSDKYKSEVNSSGLSNTMGSTMSGAQAGASVAGPWGAVVGGGVGLVSGLFGWGSSKRKLQKRMNDARQLTSRTNTFNRSGAMSTGLSNQYYQNYGNTQDDVLYS